MFVLALTGPPYHVTFSSFCPFIELPQCRKQYCFSLLSAYHHLYFTLLLESLLILYNTFSILLILCPNYSILLLILCTTFKHISTFTLYYFKHIATDNLHYCKHIVLYISTLCPDFLPSENISKSCS